MKTKKKKADPAPKGVREVTLDGASSHRSFEGNKTRPVEYKRSRAGRRVAPDKGELSPR